MKINFKKVIAVILTVCAMLSITSCGLLGIGNKKEEPDDVYDKNDACAKINESLDKSYKSLALTVKTEMSGSALTSVFNFTEDTLTYSIEELATFETEDGEFIIPESYKKTTTGSAEIKNGTVVGIDGAIIPPMAGEAYLGGFNIPVGEVTNFKNDGNTDTMAFKDGTPIVPGMDMAKDIMLTVTYSEKLESVIIEYTVNTTRVTLTYDYGALA